MRIFNFLLNFWLLNPMMMFAAGEAIGDVSGGGGDASGAVSTDTFTESSDVSGSDAAGDSAIESGGDSSSQLREGESGSGGEGSDPNALVDSGDGRKIPQKFSEIFKANKDLKESYFVAQALRKEFPGGLREVKQLKADLEEVGGLDAVRDVQGQLDTYHKDSELFESGDPKWTETAFKENPDAALTHWRNAIDYVSENFPEEYDHVASKIIVNDIDGRGGFPVREIHALLASIKENPQAKALADQLASYFNDRMKLSANAPQKRVNPEAKKLEERANELSQKEQKLRNDNINSQAFPYLTRSIESNIDKAAQLNGFDIKTAREGQPERYERFKKDVLRAVHENVLQDSKFLDRYSAALASNDVAKCVRMLNARHDQAINGDGLKPGIAAKLFQEWFGPFKGAKKTAANTNGTQTRTAGTQSTSTLQVSSMPAPKDIDYNHPKTRIIDQVAMRKDGKLVTWAK